MKNYRAPLRFHPSKSIASRIAPAILGLTLFSAATVSAVEVSYRFYRFTPTKNYQDTDQTTTTSVQLSEFTFSLRGKLLNLNGSTGVGPAVTVSASGGTNTDPTAAEYASKVIDGDLTTKWFNGDRTQPLIFDFGTATAVDSYNFATANDFLARTPISWTLEGSADGVTWVGLDSRADVAPAANLFFYQAGFPIGGTSALPTVAVNGAIAQDTENRPAAASTILKNGSSTTLAWTVTNSTAQSLVNPAGTATTIAATGSQQITPASGKDSVYSLSATNAAGNSALPAFVRTVPGTSTSYYYYRLTTTGRRGGKASNLVQLSEFEMYNGTTKRVLGGVNNPGGQSNDGEGSQNLIDGSLTTKWLDFNNQPLIFLAELDSNTNTPLPVDSYQLFTANDSDDRDPIRWTLEGSNDLDSWTIIDAVTTQSYATPTARNTGAGKIPLSGTALRWSGASAAWDLTATNFKPLSGSTTATAFRAGAPVVFDDSATQTSVTLSGEIEPGWLNFSNSTKNYTLSGSPVIGRTSLAKSGTGSLTLGAVNGFNGDISITDGTVISSVAGALGPRTFNRSLTLTSYLSAAPKLQIPVTQSFQGTLTTQGDIDTSSTINVADGATFGSYGPLVLGGTLVKTGKGTLHIEDYKGGATSTFGDAMTINEGMVEFSSSYWNSQPLGNRVFNATINSGAVMRLTTNDVFGGDYVDLQSSLSQLRVIGGTLRLNGNQYIPTPLVGGEGPIVLDGGRIDGGFTLDTSHDGSNQRRSTITVRPNAVGSVIVNTNFNTSNATAFDPGSQLVLDVADGAAADDLAIVEDGTVPTYKITGDYGIVKTGAGNLVLGLASDYKGAGRAEFGQTDGTTVTAGTLTVTNATGSATGTGTVLVASGATLAGTGIITGDTTVKGTLSPGKGAIGTITLGNTTVSGGVAYKVSGADSDKIVVNGNLNLTGSTLAISAATAPTAGNYVIASYTGTLTGTFASVTGLPQGYTLVSNTAAKTIAIQSGASQSGYDAWASAAGLSGADALNTADPDGDGIPNGIEFVLGGSPTTADTANLPTATRDASGNMVFTFRRASASKYLNPGVQYSADLTTWTVAPTADVVVTADGFATGIDKVVVTLPASLAPNAKLFARLVDSIALP